MFFRRASSADVVRGRQRWLACPWRRAVSASSGTVSPMRTRRGRNAAVMALVVSFIALSVTTAPATSRGAHSDDRVAAAPELDGSGARIGLPVHLEGFGFTATSKNPDRSLMSRQTSPAKAHPVEAGSIDDVVNDAKIRVAALNAEFDENQRQLVAEWGNAQLMAGRAAVAVATYRTMQTELVMRSAPDLIAASVGTSADPVATLRAEDDMMYVLNNNARRYQREHGRSSDTTLRRDMLFSRSVDLVVERANASLWLQRISSFASLIRKADLDPSTVRALVDELAQQSVDPSVSSSPDAWFSASTSTDADALARFAVDAGFMVDVVRTARVHSGGSTLEAVGVATTSWSSTTSTGTTNTGTSQRRYDAIGSSVPGTPVPMTGSALVPALWRASGWIAPEVSTVRPLPPNTSPVLPTTLVTPETLATPETLTSPKSLRSPKKKRSATVSALTADAVSLSADMTYLMKAGSSTPSWMGSDRIVVNLTDLNRLTSHSGSSYAVIIRSTGVAKNLWRVRALAAAKSMPERSIGWVPLASTYQPATQASESIGLSSFTLQEFSDNGRVDQDKPWHVSDLELPLLGPTTCSSLIASQVSGALATLAVYGLDGLIQVNGYQGCYVPRVIRNTESLSMHGRGLAVDLNVAGNAVGTSGSMDARVVSVFKAFGLRWGGDWTTSDPMHFEAAALFDRAVTHSIPLHWSKPGTSVKG